MKLTEIISRLKTMESNYRADAVEMRDSHPPSFIQILERNSDALRLAQQLLDCNYEDVFIPVASTPDPLRSPAINAATICTRDHRCASVMGGPCNGFPKARDRR